MKELDIVVYGATGFTGKQAARELCLHAPPGLKIGVAARDRARLGRVAEALPREVVTIVADSTDASSVKRMTERTRVLITTAGPYVRYGTPVLQACVATKTHYADITGETHWVRAMIDASHAQAVADGTKIVPFCGYDAVPSDIGALLTVQALRARFGEATLQVEGFHVSRGGFNGGTLATAQTLSDPKSRALLRDPFALSPTFVPPDDVRRASEDVKRVFRHPESGEWVAPFVMAQINTRVVRRSAMLAAQAARSYGERFRYNEYWHASSRFEALAVLGLERIFERVSEHTFGAKLLGVIGPKPGEGPSEHAMDTGFYRSRFLGRGIGGSRVNAEISGAGDPGNRATVLFLVEAGLALAVDAERLPTGGGILTPAAALGEPYVERLRRRGVVCEVK